MQRFLLIIWLLLLTLTQVQADETSSIQGRVIDAQTKEPLLGVNVLVMGTQRGAATDLEGNYAILNLPVGTYRLKFDFIGYTSVLITDLVVKSARATMANAEMESSYLEGEAVAVTAGYFVEEEKVQPSTIGLSREEIRRFPGGFEDVVRTVSTLPGVAINAAGGRNDLLVRGGGPSENLFTINNIEVPNINHFGSQGNSSGSLSFVNLDFVENVTFSTGGFSARYGDKMSSVLALQMMTNRPRTFESKLTVAATQYGANFETSLGNRGNFIFSARQSYLDLIFKAAGLPFVPIYTDFNIIANYDLSPKDKLFLLGLSAINRVARDQSSFENRTKNAGLLDNSQYQGITGINYQRLVAGGYLDLTFNTNLFRYRLTQIDEFEQQYYKSRADEWEVGAKAQYYWVISKFMGLRSGLSGKSILNKNTTVFADTIYDRSGKRVPLTNFGIVSPVETRTRAQKIAAFTELDWVVTPDLNVNLGVRLDDYNFLNQSAYLAPRLAVKYQIIPRLHLRASGGIYYQSPSYVWVVNPENKNLKALRNQMGVLGLDYTIREDLRVSVESFYKQYRDLPTGVLPGRTDYLVLTNTGTGFGGREDDFQSFGYFNLVSAAKGQAYGFEFLLLKKFSEIPFYGQLGLSYGKSEFTARNGRTYPNQYDQRVIFNLTGGYIFNAKWEIAGKFRYFTGVPYTPVYRPSENPLTPGSIQNLPAEYLTQRLPAGHHLDLRVDRYFNFSNVTLIVYLDIQNIYNFKVPTRPRYEFWEDTISRNNDIGILPSIGISLEL